MESANVNILIVLGNNGSVSISTESSRFSQVTVAYTSDPCSFRCFETNDPSCNCWQCTVATNFAGSEQTRQHQQRQSRPKSSSIANYLTPSASPTDSTATAVAAVTGISTKINPQNQRLVNLLYFYCIFVFLFFFSLPL